MTSGTSYEKYLTDDIYPEDPPIEDSPTDISREDDLDDGSTYIDDGRLAYNFRHYSKLHNNLLALSAFHNYRFFSLDSVFREDGERDDPISLDLFGSKSLSKS